MAMATARLIHPCMVVSKSPRTPPAPFLLHTNKPLTTALSASFNLTLHSFDVSKDDKPLDAALETKQEDATAAAAGDGGTEGSTSPCSKLAMDFEVALSELQKVQQRIVAAERQVNSCAAAAAAACTSSTSRSVYSSTRHDPVAPESTILCTFSVRKILSKIENQ